MSSGRYDAIVVGAGTSGAGAALALARAGLTVALVERRCLVEAGASWVTDVPPRLFDLAGLPRPDPPIRRSGDHPYLLIDARTGAEVLLTENPMWSIDTPRLTAWLHDACSGQGVRIFERCEVHDPEIRTGGLRSVRIRHADREDLRLRADLFVDASGRRGSLRAMVPALSRACRALEHDEVCDASQWVCAVTDPGTARHFIRQIADRDDTFIAWIGIEGGYSTFVVHLAEDGTHVDLLAGVVPAPGRRTSSMVLDEFVGSAPWIGERVEGGGSLIPIRRPYPVFGAGHVALVGDAACQVFPSNGCGVGSGLVAAKCLADAAGSTRGRPGSPWTLARYQLLFHRRLGYANVVHDGVRLLGLRATDAMAARLMRSGLVTPGIVRASLEQRVIGWGQ